MSGHTAENDAAQTLRDAAEWLQGVSEKCCECTDGHHDQQYAYGTEADVHVSRDTARALADLLDNEANAMDRADGFARDYAHVQTATYNEARRSLLLAVARGVLTGRPIPPGEQDGGTA